MTPGVSTRTYSEDMLLSSREGVDELFPEKKGA